MKKRKNTKDLLQQINEEEKAMILKHREEQKANKVQKTGRLKHPLWYNNAAYSASDYDWLMTAKELNAAIKEIKESCYTKIDAGTEFVCYVVANEEEWYDNINFGIEVMDKDWAIKHLKDIKEASSNDYQ